MPCYDERNDPKYMRMIKDREDREFEAKYGTRDPDKLRDMLCKVCTMIEEVNDELSEGCNNTDCCANFLCYELLDEVQEWFNRHKQWDKDTAK